MDKLSLIRFNDDNHAERIFINGEYVGNLYDIAEIIENAIRIGKDLNDEYNFKETEVYVCDDFYDYDEDDDIVENIWDFFNNTEQMTEEQVKLIQEKNWEELNKII